MKRVIVAVLVAVILSCGRDASYYLEKGNQALRQGDLNGAISYYEKAVKAEPKNHEAHNSLGAALSASGRFDEAIEHFSIAIALKDDFLEGHYNLAKALNEVGRLDEAIVEVKKVLSLDSTYALAYVLLGEVYWKKGKPDSSVAAYLAGIKQDRYLLSAYLGLSRVCMAMKWYDKGIEYLLKARDLYPDRADLVSTAGKAAILKGDLDLAVELLTEAAQMDSSNLLYRNDLATALMLAGRRTEAIQQWESILARNPDPSLKQAVEANLKRASRNQ